MNELWLYDIIGDGFWSEGLTGRSVRDALAEFDPEEPLAVRINSPGGDVFEAQAIRTLLSEWQAVVDVQIDGVAAEIIASENVLVRLVTRDAPSPVLAASVVELGAAAGMVFTGSHNPPEYNGLKIYTADGILAATEFTDRVEARAEKLAGGLPFVRGNPTPQR